VIPPQGGEGLVIDAVIHPRNGSTGVTRVSNPVPLRVGDLPAGALSTISIHVLGVEQRIAVRALDMLENGDDSLRGVHVEFDYNVGDGSADIVAEIRIGASRSTVDISPTEPATEDPDAICVPSDPEYLCATEFYGSMPGIKSKAFVDANYATLYRNRIDLLIDQVGFDREQFDAVTNRSLVGFDGGGYNIGIAAVEAWLRTGSPAHYDTALMVSEYQWSSAHGNAMSGQSFYTANVHVVWNAHIRYGLCGSSNQRADVNLDTERWMAAYNVTDIAGTPVFNNAPAPTSANAHTHATQSPYYEGRIWGKTAMAMELHCLVYDPAYVPITLTTPTTSTVREFADVFVDMNLDHVDYVAGGAASGSGLNVTNHDLNNGDAEPAIGVKPWMDNYRHQGLYMHYLNGGAHAAAAIALIEDYAVTMDTFELTVPGTPLAFNGGDPTNPDTWAYVILTISQDPWYTESSDNPHFATEALNALASTADAITYIVSARSASKTRVAAGLQAAYDDRATWVDGTNSFQFKFRHQECENSHLVNRVAA
jgi:hypothetical protein